MFSRHAIGYCHNLFRAIAIAPLRLQDSWRLIARGDSQRIGSRQRDDSKRSRRVRPLLLIHYHIFKNAGTSFKWSIIDALGEKAFASYDSSSPQGFISRRDLTSFAVRHPEITVLSSHQAAPPAPAIYGREVFSSILIRDPIARIRSMYAFECRQKASSRGAIMAKQLNFKRYVQWRLEETPSVLCNYQVYFCSRKPNDDIFLPGPERVEQAIANFDNISIVGTVARYEEWLALTQKVLSTALPQLTLDVKRRNTTEANEPSEEQILGQLITDLGEATAEYLLENNKLDMCLHQIADALLTRRLAEHGVRTTLHQTYSKVRQSWQSQQEPKSGPQS